MAHKTWVVQQKRQIINRLKLSSFGEENKKEPVSEAGSRQSRPHSGSFSTKHNRGPWCCQKLCVEENK